MSIIVKGPRDLDWNPDPDPDCDHSMTHGSVIVCTKTNKLIGKIDCPACKREWEIRE